MVFDGSAEWRMTSIIRGIHESLRQNFEITG
jgi:hypothetical protein